MRTVEEVLADLRKLAAKATNGENVSAERAALERELAEHGIRVAPAQTAAPAHPGGSRFATRATASRDELAARLQRGEAEAIAKDGRTGSGTSIIRVLRDVRAAKAGDHGAHGRLAVVTRQAPTDAEKAITGGGFLVEVAQLNGYLEALSGANPIRGLATEHDVKGREVRLVVEGDDILVTEHVPEGATKPSSNASVVQVVSTVHKAAGVTDVPDELVEDSDGAAEDIITSQFARSIGITVDVALLDGTGTGQPLGILRHEDVDHSLVAGQTPMAIYAAIVRRLGVLKGRFNTNLSVVLHPDVLERFDLDLDDNGTFRWPDGLQGKLADKARVVEDPNLPVAVDGTVPIIVGSFKRGLHVFSRKALVIEQSNAPGFISDETTFRAVERYGAAVAKPSCFEIIDGTDLTEGV